MLGKHVNMSNVTSMPAEVFELCKKLNLNPEETISQALSLLNVSVQIQEQGYQIQARRKKGILGWREVRNILIRR